MSLIEVPLTRCTGHPFVLRHLLGTSVKVDKSLAGDKVMTPIMYLAPHKKLAMSLGDDRFEVIMDAVSDWAGMEYGKLRRLVIGHNSCPGACTCPNVCLATHSGNLRLRDQQEFEMLKTLMWLAQPHWFANQLQHEILNHHFRLRRGFKYKGTQYKGGEVQLHVRLNGGSDIDFVGMDYINPIRNQKDVQFYDYTKVWRRMRDYLDGELPDNYHLTWSAGSRDYSTYNFMQRGGNVAVVFKNMPNEGLNVLIKGCPRYTVIDGTKSDARALDPKHSIVALKPLGSAAKKVDVAKQSFIFEDIMDFHKRMTHCHEVDTGVTSGCEVRASNCYVYGPKPQVSQ